jgi:sensor histidine kinase YesM
VSPPSSSTSSSATPGEGGGIGLSNTRARLAQLYGEGHRFDVRDRGEGGVEARLVIPFRRNDEGGMRQDE